MEFQGNSNIIKDDLALVLNKSFNKHAGGTAVYYSHGNRCLTLTYAELATRIKAQGQQILELAGETRQLLGLLFTNPVDQLVAVLACFSRAAPFIVLDVGLPPERLAFITANSGIKICLTGKDGQDLCAPEGIQMVQVRLDTIGPQEADSHLFEPRYPSALAYVNYTSGSTGQPKGICHSWREVSVNILWCLREYSQVGPGQNVLQLAPLFWDSSVRQLLWPLAAGAAITTLPVGVAAGAVGQWIDLLEERGVTDIFIVPTLLAALLEHMRLRRHKMALSIERVFSVGEALHTKLAEEALALLPPCTRLYNQYGVSEISGNLSSHLYESAEETPAPAGAIKKYVAIGRLLEHVHYRIVEQDSSGVGNLAVRVEGMSQAYIGGVQPERFILLDGVIYFLTGDRVRMQRGGVLVAEGRVDYQVKILGNRVELPEIECVIGAFEGVRGVAVLLKHQRKEDADMPPMLVAYVSGCVNVRQLAAYVRKYLPYYMVPARFVGLPELPRLPNGKLDRVALSRRQDVDLNSNALLNGTNDGDLTPVQAAVVDAFTRVLRTTCTLHSNFFELGGNSLLMYQLLSLLASELGVRLSAADLYNNPTAEELAGRLQAVEGTPKVLVEPLPTPASPADGDSFPLQPLQLAYLAGRTTDGSTVPIHDYLELKCRPLDIARLEEAFDRVIRRHDMLRCVVTEDGEFQRVLAPQLVPRYEIKVHCPGEGELDAHLTTVRSRMSHQIFDLTRFPCFEIRVTCAREEGNHGDFLHLSFDGLFIDAKSFEIILNDWSALYRHPETELPSLGYTFREYVNQAACNLHGPESPFLRADEEYWARRIDLGEEGLPLGPDLPLKSNHAGSGGRFSRVCSAVEPAAWDRINALATAQGSGFTINSLLLTAFASAISCFSARKTFGLNVTLDSRTPFHPDVAAMVGNFTSTMILECTRPRREGPFRDALLATRDRLAEDLEHRLFTGIDVQRRLLVRGRGPRAPGTPLYPVVFTNLLGIDRHYERLFGGEVEATTCHITQTPQVWIDCKVYEDGRGLVIEWDYLEGIFPEGLLDVMHGLYVRNLGIIAQHGVDVPHKWLTPQNEPLPAPVKWGDEMACLHTLFARSVERGRDHPAVVTGSGPQTVTLTYGQLAEKVEALARHLAECIADSETMVGIMMGKGVAQIVSALAILSLGKAYVPLDPAWPATRLLSIVPRCGMKTILTCPGCQHVGELFPEGGVKCVIVKSSGNQIWEERRGPGPTDSITGASDLDRIAYVIFTSGTTGEPKGVAVTHRAAVNTILDINHRIGLSPADRVFAISELTFDLSVYDIFGTLAAGATIVLPGFESKRDPDTWERLMMEHRVTIWNSVPAYLQMLVDPDRCNPSQTAPHFAHLRWALLSGDRIPLTLPDIVRKLAPSCAVMSLGGATEAGIWSICYLMEGEVDPEWRTIPYGKSLTNQSVWVLDEELEPCPIWVEGEISIGGAGLAVGYLGDEEKSRAAFFSHPETGERLYRTGDRGALMSDGNIEFLGRRDDQVKLNGYRIELGEISNALLKHYLVSDAHVMLSAGGAGMASQICAFVRSDHNRAVATTDGTKDVEVLYNLKRAGGGLREGRAHVLLHPRAQNRADYFQRKSYRCFGPESEVTPSEVDALFKRCCMTKPPRKEQQPVHAALEDLGSLLAPLAQFRGNTTAEFPKYTYASAGSLYPVQVYLKLNQDAMKGMEAGYYYYDPVQHGLSLLAPTEPPAPGVEHEQMVTLILVGKYSALAPIYGKGELAESLMWMNAGYLLGALNYGADARCGEWTWGGLKLGKDGEFKGLRAVLQNGADGEVLCSTTLTTLNGLSSTAICSLLWEEMRILVSIKQSGASKPETVMEFQPSLGSAASLQRMNSKSKDHVGIGAAMAAAFSRSRDSSLIFGDATLAIFITTVEARTRDPTSLELLRSGLLGHFLQTEAVHLVIGLCPIGGLSQDADLQGRLLCHALLGGRVTKTQMASERPSLVPQQDAGRLSDAVTHFLRKQVPAYMMPSVVHLLDKWPLTANGKIDTSALQRIVSATKTEGAASRAKASTESPEAETLLKIIEQVLAMGGTSSLSLGDNFFRLGGDSIGAVKLVGRLRSHFQGIEITVLDVLQNPELESLHVLLQERIARANR